MQGSQNLYVSIFDSLVYVLYIPCPFIEISKSLNRYYYISLERERIPATKRDNTHNWFGEYFSIVPVLGDLYETQLVLTFVETKCVTRHTYLWRKQNKIVRCAAEGLQKADIKKYFTF